MPNPSAPRSIRKIAAIRNVGTFRNSGASGQTSLAKHTVIFGANGSGKTTLCAILRSMETGDPSGILGRARLRRASEPEIDVVLDQGSIVFRAGHWNQTLPDLALFDSTFISENVYAGDVVDLEHRRNLYRVIVGKGGVDLAVSEENLTRSIRSKTTEIAGVQSSLSLHFPPQLGLEAFIKLPRDPAIGKKIKAKEQELASLRQIQAIQARAGLEEITVPTIPEGLIKVLDTTLEGIEATAEADILQHIATHNMGTVGQQWLSQGLQFLANNECPYCGQDVSSVDLIRSYRTYFSRAYSQLKRDVHTLIDQLKIVFGESAVAEIELAVERNKGSIDFWSQHCDLTELDFSFPNGLRKRIASLRKSVHLLLDRKAASPLERIPPDAEFKQSTDLLEDLKRSAVAYNQVVRRANGAISTAKAALKTSDVRILEMEIARLKAVEKRQEKAVDELCRQYQSLCSEKSAMEREKTDVRRKLEAHTKTVVGSYEGRLNELLEKFNTGFRVTKTTHTYAGGIATSSYQLIINQTAIPIGDSKTPTSQPSFRNTLSSGDRSTLALAFFLAHLEGSQNLADRIVVFDDPFNSQDRFRRNQTIHEICRLGAKCRQVIVLSHDATFIKQLWEKLPKDNRAPLQLVDGAEAGTKIMPYDIEASCIGRAEAELDDLQLYLTKREGDPLDVVKKMRIVLEAYCRSAYMGYFDAKDNLGEIVRKIREKGTSHPADSICDELDCINSYSCGFHHGPSVLNDGDTVDSIDATELAGLVGRTLKVIRFV